MPLHEHYDDEVKGNIMQWDVACGKRGEEGRRGGLLYSPPLPMRGAYFGVGLSILHLPSISRDVVNEVQLNSMKFNTTNGRRWNCKEREQ